MTGDYPDMSALTCNHIGPCGIGCGSYFESDWFGSRHYIAPAPMWTWTETRTCEHCYCKDGGLVVDGRKRIPHKRCCKCLTTRKGLPE